MIPESCGLRSNATRARLVPSNAFQAFSASPAPTLLSLSVRRPAARNLSRYLETPATPSRQSVAGSILILTSHRFLLYIHRRSESFYPPHPFGDGARGCRKAASAFLWPI